jgi:type IV/VI secretion system ImpK/VasF family protein
MPTLREVFTPLIAYMLFFARSPVEQQRPFADLRTAIERLLGDQRTAVKRLDLSLTDYENASFAIVAWLDETVMRCAHDSNTTLFGEWRRSPLQVELFNTANAGEEFFDRLARLTPAQKQVTELYYLALCLGFRGRYYDDSQAVQLIDLRHQYATYLPAPLIELLDFEKHQEHVTPEPYLVAAPVAKPLDKARSPYWWLVPIAAVAALLLYLLWPSGPNLQEVQEAVASFECAQISVDSIEHGVVKLSGHVDSDDQRDLLRQKVESIHRVKGVDEDLTVIPRPFCEVIEVLAPLKALSNKDGFDLEISPSKGCNATYLNGEHLVVDVTAKKPLNYVYVDYYVADKENVAHMLPNPQELDNAVKQAATLTVGGTSDKAQWQIQPPYGREMVTVISSPKPLFTPARTIPESAEDYLASLREALKAEAPDSDMAATYCFTMSAEQ